ncbi:Na+/H+ antiporter NhaC family protein [Salmonella enterica subsp. diarizonae]|uniref:Na+/H+ antiporter NhaC family protein n=2 Tax=Salmonella enterica TaxID=28901 RepID=A0A7Z1T046_SALET|nr:Na+/H+ antiporter NhaC family protein [Salmonella enterica]EAB9741993.1 Na+/H+ antiporter NhaC family protein [Salmonella enterica subsp. diarizonae]EDS4951512.1 Na+/H+ antiporter NhaC family protein [Salmonella enterica subsp. enterica serovar Redlands]EDT6985005.1 Na+/H+ antiporter NhaC family protein [Salmonella enterica subsp. arizonae]ESJ23209.1 hypothetical protein SED60170_01237 [Salmonella enterica subsp. diarizonae serovar 60:r:e,n,x,z15 str. 01-0170]MCH5485496.1 Na+/H+ antiporter 
MNNDELTFRGGKNMALLPMFLFIVSCSLFFSVFHVFDMIALAMCAFLAIMVGAIFSRNASDYWKAVVREGIGSEMAVTIATILLIIGMYAKMIAQSGVADSFALLANQLGLHGGAFTVFTFVSVCIVATATGTSIGTLFTAFPVFYPSGILLGADPIVLASAILCGAIFGDNIAPISDTTVASASTQSYQYRPGSAEIAGVVAARFRFAIVSALIASTLFYIFGSNPSPLAEANIHQDHEATYKSLWMLVPMAVLLIVAMKTRNIFKAIPSGILTGIIVGLLFGIFNVTDIFALESGNVSGFLYKGFHEMVSTILFVLSLFGIIGILRASKTMDRVSSAICRSRLAQSSQGAEWCIAIGSIIATALVGGVTSASILAFGPVASEIGSRKSLHPYRRAVLVDCFAMTLAAIIPFLSAFIFIVSAIIVSLQKNYPFIQTVNPIHLSLTAFYPIALFIVMSFSVIVGWGRRFEDKGGLQSRVAPE